MTVYTDDNLPYSTVNLSLPQAKDNSETEPILWSIPAFDEENPVKLNIGISEIQIFAMDSSNNNRTCSFFVDVKGNNNSQLPLAVCQIHQISITKNRHIKAKVKFS